jgi:hypothetical protein
MYDSENPVSRRVRAEAATRLGGIMNYRMASLLTFILVVCGAATSVNAQISACPDTPGGGRPSPQGFPYYFRAHPDEVNARKDAIYFAKGRQFTICSFRVYNDPKQPLIIAYAIFYDRP